MSINDFKTKFKVFKEFENEMPGIKIGLDLLKDLNLKIKTISPEKESKLKVDFYNFEEEKIIEYSVVTLNSLLFSLYNENILIKKILHNKLYCIFCEVYGEIYKKYNYSYKDDKIDMHDIIAKIFKGFRRNIFEEKFYFNKIIQVFDRPFFNSKVTPQESYAFILNFILKLEESGVLCFNKSDASITFNEIFIPDLSSLLNFSFNLMILGKNDFYDSFDLSEDNIELNVNRLIIIYKRSDFNHKMFLNDMVTSLVLSSSVMVICGNSETNNIFFDSISNGSTKK